MSHLKNCVIDHGHFVFCPTYRKTPHVFADDCLYCEFWGYLILVVFAASLAALEFYGYSLSWGLSLKGDAWHVAVDGVGYLLSLIGVVSAAASTESADKIRSQFTRIVAVLLLMSATNIFMEAYSRFMGGRLPIDGMIMFWIALIGLVGNILMFWMLKQLDLNHSHGSEACGHQHSSNRLREANLWHILSDTLSSVLVVTVAAVAWVFAWQSWVTLLDLLGSVAIASLLAYQGLRIIWVEIR